MGQCDGEKEDEEKRKGRVACWRKQRGAEGDQETKGCRTVSAYVREIPQIGHSLRSDGLKLHSGGGGCAHTTRNHTRTYTQQAHNTETRILYSAGGRGMTNLKGGCTVPHSSWGLKFNPAVKLEGLRCMSQQF